MEGEYRGRGLERRYGGEGVESREVWRGRVGVECRGGSGGSGGV